ncbi:hypothetical protein [Paenibacillus pabuli]|uniref:hypothetical protein n=1 Tax=Paenibacillus pabuli TaxID=1472 RepID=UPI000A57ABEE|nr:hypothetical protein [Paenibacillus pabuli]MEC0129005.1 hypothetical protein [Paenibacillus pabuli]
MAMWLVPKLVFAGMIGLSVSFPAPAPDRTILAEVKENQTHITLVAASKPVDGTYSGMTVLLNDQKRTFPWGNISEPAFYPEIVMSNVDGIGPDETIIILTTGKGTGIRTSEVHVLKDDWNEIPVRNAVAEARNLLSSVRKESVTSVEYTLDIKGKKYGYSFPIGDAELWFEQAVVGHILRYRVQDNKLIAEIPVQVSPGIFTGSIEVEYKEKQGTLVPFQVSYVEDR